MAIEIKLTRPSRIYHPLDILDGTVIITTPTTISHQGIRIHVNGQVNLQLSPRAVGVIESLYSFIKPVHIINKAMDIRSAGKLNSGKTEIPFNMALHVLNGDIDNFYETFHGLNINIQYLISADVVRGYLHKSLSTTLEFIIESGKGKLLKAPILSESVSFYITQDTQRHQLLPALRSGGFRITGRVATHCSLTDPITGEVTVDASAVPIRSIDVQLIRVESIVVGERTAVETSDIQTTQVADGDVCRRMSLPIYIILPRLLTCPSLSAVHNEYYACFATKSSMQIWYLDTSLQDKCSSFSIEFQLSIVVSFESELAKLYAKSELSTSRQWVAFETLPLRLVRTEREEEA